MGRSAIHAAIVKLSPWSRHHATCARVADAADCDCGLQATLLEVDPAPTSQSGDSGQTDVPLPFGEEFA